MHTYIATSIHVQIPLVALCRLPGSSLRSCKHALRVDWQASTRIVVYDSGRGDKNTAAPAVVAQPRD
eukprot:12681-Eustigmatos_ZCMA.PRE.1